MTHAKSQCVDQDPAYTGRVSLVLPVPGGGTQTYHGAFTVPSHLEDEDIVKHFAFCAKHKTIAILTAWRDGAL